MSPCHGQALTAACGAPLARRRFVQLAGTAAGAGLLNIWLPRLAFAAGGAEALVLTCIDYRFIDHTAVFLRAKGMDGKYDQAILAGASLGVVSEKFEGWHQTFWDHVDVAIDLHGIREVIAIDHRDCGAYKIALGADSMATPETETAAHERILKAFGEQVRARYPGLGVSGYLLALDGTAQQFDI